MKPLILLLLILLTSGACFQSDVRQSCCPSACMARSGPHWTEADAILQSCAKAIGCEHVDNWTVFMRCQCPKVKP